MLSIEEVADTLGDTIGNLDSIVIYIIDNIDDS